MYSQPSIPKVAIVPVTYRCNAKCVMCNIWQEHEDGIKLENLLRFFEDPLIANNLQSVNLTGGEPTLRTDLVEIAAGILARCSQLNSITINTNGLKTEHLKSVIIELCRLKSELRSYELLVFLSLDGLEDTHEKVRGVPGGFGKVMRSIDALEQLKAELSFSFSINFTISPINFMQMEDVYNLIAARRLKIDYTYSMKSSIYFNNVGIENGEWNDQAIRAHIADTLLRLMRRGNLSYSHSYYKNLIEMIQGGPRKIGCIFANEGFFLHPSGAVYRCWAYDVKLGNAYESSFSDIWYGKRAIESLSEIRKQCENCYNNCYSHFKRIDSIRSFLNKGGKAVK